MQRVAGLELPDKLRRGLGGGKVVPADELAKRMAPFDADGDDALTRPELQEFLHKNRVGGVWFCQIMSKTLWKYMEQHVGKECPTITLDMLGKIITFVMSRGPRPERRYEITPEGMTGYKPLEPLRRPGERLPGDAKPRATPRGDPTTPRRSQNQTPGRASAQGPGRSGPRRPVPRRPGPRRV
jgi:hypothetical protein